MQGCGSNCLSHEVHTDGSREGVAEDNDAKQGNRGREVDDWWGDSTEKDEEGGAEEDEDGGAEEDEVLKHVWARREVVLCMCQSNSCISSDL